MKKKGGRPKNRWTLQLGHWRRRRLGERLGQLTAMPWFNFRLHRRNYVLGIREGRTPLSTWGSMPNKNGQKHQKKKKRDVWRREGEKERMHGDILILSVGGSRIYERTSKTKEEFEEVHYWEKWWSRLACWEKGSFRTTTFSSQIASDHSAMNTNWKRPGMSTYPLRESNPCLRHEKTMS